MFIYDFVTSLTRAQKRLVFLFIDAAMVPVALFLSILLNASTSLTGQLIVAIAPITAALIGTAMLASHFLGLTRITLNAY